MIKIDYLKNHPQFINLLSEIWFGVLGSIWLPDISSAQVIEKLDNHLNTDFLPITFVAIKDNQPIGMCSLRQNDGIRPDLTPWLGGFWSLIKIIKIWASARCLSKL